jgi:hypothetical protein
MKNPPCSNWRSWLGLEVEGDRAIGVKTLFVRFGDVLKLLDANPDVTRVWLCKEYTASHSEISLTVLCRKLRLRSIDIAVEVLAQYYREYLYLRPFVNYYIKYDVPDLKNGDHICVGPAFNDEAFCIGQGKKVTPGDYANDIRIE